MNSSVRATASEAIEIIKNGGMVILVDDEDRENEGDLVIASQFATAEAINFMAKYGRGLVCSSLTAERCDQLELSQMAENNDCRFGTAFTVSIEARQGVTTGISAFDRARTVKTAIDPNTKPEDLARPGHIFPLRAKDGGVLVRGGQTEGSVDLARLAGLYPSGVICEIMEEDGSMARMPSLEKFAEKHGLKIVTIADIIEYRIKNDNIVEQVSEANLTTALGTFKVIGFRNRADGSEAVALVKGHISGTEPVLVRVHSQCLTGDVFGSMRCDCGSQLHSAMAMVENAGCGVILYMFQEGRGIGLLNKIRAYKLQDEGFDTVEANLHLGFKDDQRDYGFGAQILKKLGLSKIQLLTNNPRKIYGLAGFGIEIVKRVPIECGINSENLKYMKTKKEKLGHQLDITEV
ncbi:MAG: bifunctional 3,4-dihydroxy-2-butanone-4-phosphate synthase/GTP cyclohydrolase II [Deferribacterales bacterium]|nr:bifunctional 3,4-dihydroxy-2-butanone-4-phosphate synthase/GTP cyclohydrolase II [Deferribacterales bacterium]